MKAITFPAPPGVLLHTIHAPGFTAPPPDLRHAHLIPPAELAAMQTAWHWGEYAPVDVTLSLLEDVTIAEDGLVFLPGAELVPASVTQNQPPEIAFARAAILAAGDTAPRLSGPHVLCVKSGVTNYGHWLAEMLPMALLADRLLGDGVRFLVPAANGPLGASIQASLHLAGIAPARIVAPGFAPCRVAELIMVQGLSMHGLYLSPLVAELLQGLAAPVPPAAPGNKLWVSRAGAPRDFWNGAEFAAVLAELGWQVVSPGAMAFAEQVALFKGATRIAGVMGAGLANALFAPPGARLDVLAPANMPDTFFYLIARLRGLAYRETRCMQTFANRGRTPWDNALVTALPELLAALS